MEKQTDTAGARLGMWLFLFTEILLFGGLFVLYAAYFHQYPGDFISGGKQMDLDLGTINTIVLLLSSFTVAASMTAYHRGSRTQTVVFLMSSVVLGLVFLINKYFEWGHKFKLELYPNSSVLSGKPRGENIFYGLYYVITGLHGVHVLVGMILLTITAVTIHRGSRDPHSALHENCGLYWHLVDVIWIFIFPLFYLVV